MLLKVGELARRTGLTVRTLHHYDSIGLLRPSARSDSGYRLYNQADVTRLHGIQVLRRIGLPLEEIGAMLADAGASLPVIVARQLRALEREIEQATALRDRLQLVQAKFAAGSEPELNDWLDTLQLMSTCDKYFSAAEMKLIFGNWARIEVQWTQLVDDVREVMEAGTAPLDPAVQPLAQRWMNLMHTWMGGDFDLMLRWGEMYSVEASDHHRAWPGLSMIRYIEQAVQLRLSLLYRYLGEDELKRLAPLPDADWDSLARQVMALIPQQLPPQSPPVLAVLKRWNEMVDHVTRRDPQLRQKLQRAYENEPLLRDASPLGPVARDYLMRAGAAVAAAGPLPIQPSRPRQRAPAGA